ncbi:iron-sulfur cluster-binding protein [Iodobacter ciconiae]|uniref:Iron-sulfur cluster-binding protein n=2 Tax=Iodobacter ciconiae TaxID=2496266 RepID=A0A3S8ZTS4_9NEIS|nr:LutB/LldF family L-lactate oxidation iron-sulfur protein [Iodobacter ciconiae]AZN36831.1 iron-sulfur cluster-binding protein [Iodobacter ciconiae]
MKTETLHDFTSRSRAATADGEQRKKFRSAMDFLIGKRAAQFPDTAQWTALRESGQQIRQRALARLPDLLAQFEKKAQQNGMTVHWAETPQEANQIIHGILQQQQARTLIKGKSMVSEEIELNHYLQTHSIKALESDMGEFIVQLADEKPSHIIMPAIHKSKQEIATLFAAEIDDTAYTEDVDELIQIGRQALRRQFLNADAGLSGVNFAIAETGTLCLVENEGNGRLSTSVPRVHIAITGIEKMLENLADLPPLLTLLTRSATGQPITTYVNLISGPRRTDEQDGPEEVHIVLLDNGRSQAYADVQLRQTLQCIRCGACMNHCPVYTRIGGHAYGTTYPGPIGSIISPHLLGLEETRDLPSASTLCGACGDVCPVKIPIPELLLRLRVENVTRAGTKDHQEVMRGQGAKYRLSEKLAWQAWSLVNVKPALYLASRRSVTGLRHLIPSAKSWTQVRVMPKIAPQSLHELIKAHQEKKS